jgi:hypothetical protein
LACTSAWRWSRGGRPRLDEERKGGASGLVSMMSEQRRR